eukprot:5566478-Amphidinium_carterae.1
MRHVLKTAVLKIHFRTHNLFSVCRDGGKVADIYNSKPHPQGAASKRSEYLDTQRRCRSEAR